MISRNYLAMLGFSLAASFLTAYSHAACASGRFQLSTLVLPGVIEGASAFAFVLGVLFSPFAYWCLRGKKLLIVLPILYGTAPIVTVLLSLHIGSHALYGMIVFWVIALLVMRSYGPST